MVLSHHIKLSNIIIQIPIVHLYMILTCYRSAFRYLEESCGGCFWLIYYYMNWNITNLITYISQNHPWLLLSVRFIPFLELLRCDLFVPEYNFCDHKALSVCIACSYNYRVLYNAWHLGTHIFDK